MLMSTVCHLTLCSPPTCPGIPENLEFFLVFKCPEKNKKQICVENPGIAEKLGENVDLNDIYAVHCQGMQAIISTVLPPPQTVTTLPFAALLMSRVARHKAVSTSETTLHILL